METNYFTKGTNHLSVEFGCSATDKSHILGVNDDLQYIYLLDKSYKVLCTVHQLKFGLKWLKQGFLLGKQISLLFFWSELQKPNLPFKKKKSHKSSLVICGDVQSGTATTFGCIERAEVMAGKAVLCDELCFVGWFVGGCLLSACHGCVSFSMLALSWCGLFKSAILRIPSSRIHELLK